MPYHKPLTGDGCREGPYFHFIKLCWFYVHFNDIPNKISIRKFCKNFQELVINSGIIDQIETDFNLSWDEAIKSRESPIPDYDCDLMKRFSKPKKYKWEEHYNIFRKDKILSTPDTEYEKFVRNVANLNNASYETINNCIEKESEYKRLEKEIDKDMTYYSNKNSETKINEEKQWMERLNFIREQETTSDVIPVSDNPEHEIEEIAEEWDKLMWKEIGEDRPW